MDLKLEEVDFLLYEIDDTTLSQACRAIEDEHFLTEGVHNLSLSQYFQSIEHSEMEISSGNDGVLGDFSMYFPDENKMDITAALPTSEADNRFAKQVTDDEIQDLIKAQENKNTRQNTQWAFNVFDKWRNVRHGVPELQEMTVDDINVHLGKFFMECRKQDGNEYPPRSLYLLAIGLLRKMRDTNVNDKNFLDNNDSRFAPLRKVLDARMKERLSLGFGTHVKQADPIMPEDEEKIWEKGVFGNHNAEALQYTIFFYCCKLFGLRAYDEHHGLECDQFSVGENQKGMYIEFTGRQSKTFKGGLAQRQIENKKIKHHCQPGDRCIAKYFEEYLRLLGNCGKFYRRPLPGEPMRYSNQAVGINKLKSMIKTVCQRAGLEGNFSNHSGKKTCATQLYIAGVDEQDIMARTGHRSEKAVRKYKIQNDIVGSQVSAVLDPPQPQQRKRKAGDMDVTESEESIAPIGKVGKSQPLHDITNGPQYFANCQVTINLSK